MPKSYEATYEKGRLEWLQEKPNLKDGTKLIVTVDSESWMPTSPDEIRRTLREVDGAWGKGKTLEDIDREVESVRKGDWPENGQAAR